MALPVNIDDLVSHRKVEWARSEYKEGFTIFSIVRIGERSGMGLSSLYGVWEKEKFSAPSIVESYEPDRTKVTVEYEPDESEVGEKTGEVIGNTTEVKEKNSEVGEKAGVSDDVKAGSVHVNLISVQENLISDHVKPISDDVNRDFEVLMGAYRSDFRENIRKVLYAFAENPEADIQGVAKLLGFSVKSVWRAIRSMKEVGLLVREGGDKGGKWIIKKIEDRK